MSRDVSRDVSRDIPWDNESRDSQHVAAVAMTAIAAAMIVGMAGVFVYIMYNLYKRDQVIPTATPLRSVGCLSVEGLEDAVEMTNEKVLEEIRQELRRMSGLERVPPGIHKTLQAVFILLGEARESVTQWSNVLILIKLGGINSLTARIGTVVRREEKLVSQARNIIASMEMGDVRVAHEEIPFLWQWASELCQY